MYVYVVYSKEEDCDRGHDGLWVDPLYSKHLF